MALNLPRLRRGTALLDKDGGPSTQLQIQWLALVRAIEANQVGDEASRAAIAQLSAQATVRTVTTTGPLMASDYLVLANAAAGAATLTLPAAATSTGSYIIIKKTDASGNAVTVDGNGVEVIDGAATVVLAAQYNAVTVFCDGVQWWVV